jgi:uncharacterized repeat protein (TIGR01451 family)
MRREWITWFGIILAIACFVRLAKARTEGNDKPAGNPPAAPSDGSAPPDGSAIAPPPPAPVDPSNLIPPNEISPPPAEISPPSPPLAGSENAATGNDGSTLDPLAKPLDPSAQTPPEDDPRIGSRSDTKSAIRSQTPPIDPDLQRVENPPPPLSPSAGLIDRSRPTASPASTSADPEVAESATLTGEKLPEGKQDVGVTVDVVSPSVVNLNQTTTLKVVVRNRGESDAMGVVVRDELPQGLEFLDSQPSARPAGRTLVWRLGTLAVGAEKVILVKVKPVQVGVFDHSATVTIVSGCRSRTLVQEPKLKVEQTVSATKILKGGQIVIQVSVSNPGTGPARNVSVVAKLSAGLKHDQGSELKQTIPVVKAGERVKLDPLYVNASRDGEQSCEVVATSSDVVSIAPEARSVQPVTVVAPRLALNLTGPATRFTDTTAVYRIVVANPGTALARNIKVYANLPSGGRVIQPGGAQYDRYDRRLFWSIPQLDPGQSLNFSFQVRLEGVQLYQVAVETKGDGSLHDKATIDTDVKGIADVDFQVKDPLRVVDVGDYVTYEIRIRNNGTREATHLLVNAKLSENFTQDVRDIETAGTEKNAMIKPDERLIRFPEIARLAPGDGEITLFIKAKTVQPGIATCEILLMHDDLDKRQLSKTAATRVLERGVARSGRE